MRAFTEILVCVCIAAAMLLSCNTSGCLNNQSAIPLAGFYSSTTGTAITIRDIDISGVGAPGDSLLLAGTSASQLYLPMRSTADSVSWCFHYTQEGLDDIRINDTVTIGYTSEPYFASEECGAMYYYHITSLRYTTHIVDSVAITDSLVTNVDIERIKIYFRTSEEGDNDTDI